MLHYLVMGTIIASLNGIGLWHSIPLTGLNPSSTLLGRTMASLEIATSVYGLRQVYPHVFVEDDLAVKEDILLLHSIHAEEYEKARQALQKSSDAVSVLTNTPRTTIPIVNPSATRASSPVYLADDAPKIHFKEELRPLSPQGQINIHLWGSLFLLLLAMQIFELSIMLEVRANKPHYTHEDVMVMIDVFRRDSSLTVQTIAGLGENINILGHMIQQAGGRIERLFVETMTDMDMMSQRNTDSFTSIQTQISEGRRRLREMLECMKVMSDVPKQLSKLNGMLEKDIQNGLDARRLSRGSMEYFGNSHSHNSADYNAPLSPGILSGMRSSLESLSPRSSFSTERLTTALRDLATAASSPKTPSPKASSSTEPSSSTETSPSKTSSPISSPQPSSPQGSAPLDWHLTPPPSS